MLKSNFSDNTQWPDTLAHLVNVTVLLMLNQQREKKNEFNILGVGLLW